MTENTTENTAPPSSAAAPMFEAPADADPGSGYAVYDRTLGRYVGGVTTDKPSKRDADKLVGNGHVAAVVRV